MLSVVSSSSESLGRGWSRRWLYVPCPLVGRCTLFGLNLPPWLRCIQNCCAHGNSRNGTRTLWATESDEIEIVNPFSIGWLCMFGMSDDGMIRRISAMYSLNTFNNRQRLISINTWSLTIIDIERNWSTSRRCATFSKCVNNCSESTLILQSSQ